MLRKLRSIAVVIAIALGLIAQGMGMPAMASGGANIAKSDCQLMQSKCLGSGMDQHLGMQICQSPCVAPAALPRPTFAAVPVVWTEPEFAASASGLPPGLNPTPDPFPPRFLILA
jgi:hypothetical protein